MLRRLQDSPRILEFAYQMAYRLIFPFRRWLLPGSRSERFFIYLEKLTKKPIFDCRMCGQCTLHHTGMTCPMTCPKNLRNGPCGGVLPNGHCEIYPEQACIWVQAWQRSQHMSAFGREIIHIQAPLNHSLRDTSAWINDLHQKEKMIPKGWEN